MDSILAPDPPISPFLISFQVTSEVSSFQGFSDELDNLGYPSPPIRHALLIGSPLFSLVIPWHCEPLHPPNPEMGRAEYGPIRSQARNFHLSAGQLRRSYLQG